MSLNKKFKASVANAFDQTFGKKVPWVLFLLILVSWFSDLLLGLIQKLLAKHLPDFMSLWMLDIAVIVAVIFLFTIFYSKGVSSYTFSDGFIVAANKKQSPKKILICVLSPYAPQKIDKKLADKLSSEKGYLVPDEEMGYTTLEIFHNNINKDLKTKSAKELSATQFQSNWIPPLVAIEYYTEADKLIVLTTDGSGSFNQYEAFHDFVKSFIGMRNLQIHHYTEYLRDIDLHTSYSTGLPSQDLEAFTNTVLDIIHNVECENDLNCADVAVNINGGFGFMTAVLSAVSVKNGIELHHTDRELNSKPLDINAL